ncbi:ATP-binding protein [Bradyrhizobium liaoningense]|uniref:ATP-binding protein n=1 Tax=Bradyrhizobium liaoningense TaxID=43992 RepID=UPI001BA9CC71|nr:ATP-binding protein [Bradyrhizobium liaoningense]MBR0719461.1 hypothetical protein [Bradyrhizobium liaoningense]
MSQPLKIQLVPRLVLRRLVVFRKGKTAYDERFHTGVNIIRGTNSSGKSTIMDFIFHVLGGEVLGPTIQEWKEYAALCDTVVAEVTLNDATVTLRREISSDHARPLHIFFGPLETATRSVAEGWQIFPYARQEKRESFSQILFRSLAMPEASSPEGSSITMHQVLRLLYSDQMTPVQRIFRFENFDPPILKQAIGDFLCGVGEFNLYEKQVVLRDLEKKFDDLSSELKSIFSLVGGDLDTPLAREAIEKELDDLTKERIERYAELERIARSDFGSTEDTKSRELARRRALEEVARLLEKMQSLELEINTIEFEITDSNKFIGHLERMLEDIEKAALTYEQLGGIHFKYCPACFSPTNDADDPSHCHLCKTALDDSERASRGLAVKIDIQMQLRESRQLQEQRQEALALNLKALGSIRREHSSKAAAYDALSSAPMSSRDTAIANINRRIGFIDSRIETISQRLDLVSKISSMSDEKRDLNERISKIRDEIKAILAAQDKRKRTAYSLIARNVLELLHNDTGDQDAFVDASSFSFSFGNDSLSVDGKSNFAASSLVILKNSFHLGLLVASLQDNQFLLPRFMMFDNIEDKGMIPQRSWNFQQLICSASINSRTEHQVILTTSMLDPKLEGSPFVVGPAYSKEYRTLRIN